MKLKKGLLLAAMLPFFTACGGGGGGFFGETTTTPNNGGSTGTGNTDTTAVANATFNNVEAEGKFLFGFYDVGNASLPKGFIDHALDSFSAGPLQLALDARKALEIELDETQIDLSTLDEATPVGNFVYLPKCMQNGRYTQTSCFLLIDEESIKAALAKVAGTNYSQWDFDVDLTDLEDLNIEEALIENFQGKTAILIFENQNIDKSLSDIWVTGVFGYPYEQSNGSQQNKQIRLISLNNTNSEFVVDISFADQTTQSKGALSIFRDNSFKQGQKYTLQNDSAFEVLINDNLATPRSETVSFEIGSTPGNAESLSSYTILESNQNKTLDLKQITINGSRIASSPVRTITESYTGSIFMEGVQIFNFLESANGTILKFKHIINGVTFEGTSTKGTGTVTTQFTLPFNRQKTYTETLN